jgi:F0F1-type ATP synthase assembly protein I
MSKKKLKNRQEKKLKNQLNDYAKYSSLAFQMIFIIGAGVVGGHYLDKWLGFDNFPVFTFVLTIISVVLAVYYAIKDFINFKK